MAAVIQHRQAFEGHRDGKYCGHEISSHPTRHHKDYGAETINQRSKKFYDQSPSRSFQHGARDFNGVSSTGRQNKNYCDSTSSSHSHRHGDSRKAATASPWGERYCGPATPSPTTRHGQGSQAILSPEFLKSKVALVSSRRKPLSNPYQNSPLSLFNDWSINCRNAESGQVSHKLTFSQELLELSRNCRKHNTIVKRQESKSTSVSVQHHPKRKKVDDEDDIDKMANLRDLDRERGSYFEVHSVTKTETIVHKRRCPYPSLPSHSKCMLMPSEENPKNFTNSKPAISNTPTFTVTKVTRRGSGSIPITQSPILPEKLLSNYMKNVDGEKLISTTVPVAKDKIVTKHLPKKPVLVRRAVRLKTLKKKIKRRRSTVGGVLWTPVVFSLIVFSYAVKWMLY